jgi:hypothetical protein
MKTHMTPEIEFGRWLAIDTRHGSLFLPADILPTDPDAQEVTPYIGLPAGDIQAIHTVAGYGARLYAGGEDQYTEWTVFPSFDLAQEYLADLKY